MTDRRIALYRQMHALRDERGMTIVEVTVAAFLLVTVAVATLGVVDTSTRSTFRAEETQTVVNIAQREMEALRELDYGELAMTQLPPIGTSENDPSSRIRDVGGVDEFCLDRIAPSDPCPTGASAPLVVNDGPLEPAGPITGGTVAPISENVHVGDGDITVDIYRFVVWQDEGAGLPASPELCQDKPLHYRCKTQDYKRIVVAVRVNEAAISHERPYEEVQSDFIDPDRATLDAPPLGPGGDPAIGQQFWLSDTRCDVGGTDPPRSLTPDDHQSHDTLGGCGDLPDTTRPDALLTDRVDPALAVLADYSTELEICPDPPPNPLPPDWPMNCDETDVGLQMQEQAGTCTSSPGNQSQQIHRWLSRPMVTPFEMTDEATLELWTRTIGNVAASGKVCGFLFKRTAAGDVPLTDDQYFTPSWPRGEWTEVRLEFQLGSLSESDLTVAPTERLGISIGIDEEGTPNNVLEFLYDHPAGESRLEVLTTTPLS